MNLKKVYDKSYLFLIKEAEKNGITKEMVDEFISKSDVPECKDIASAYELLLIIMQDFQMYPNVIKFKERRDNIIKVLHNCDLNYISSLKENDLLKSFKKKFGFEKDAIWNKYCKSIISGAQFMLCFHDDNDFKQTFDSFDTSDMTREAFALFLSSKIYNMGFALACNWLKELGYYKYAKPDVHTKDVCKKLGLVSNNDDIACFEAMLEIANKAGVEVYKVDKVFWLICSGNFYRYNIKLTNPAGRKAEFLKYLQSI